MTKYAPEVTLATLMLDHNAETPLYRQLYEKLREAILCGQLAPRLRLPSTRNLASALGVSRNTIVNAFEQLLAEGYLEGKTGAGTFVASNLPDELLHVRGNNARTEFAGAEKRALSDRGKMLAGIQVSGSRGRGEPAPFRPGIPALDAFPYETWGQLETRHWKYATPALLSYGDAAGYLPLRKAIANYLGATRGVRCEAEQVIVVSGSQQALDLAARMLLDPGDAALVENPGYLGARGALLAAGVRVVPVPVDREGFEVAKGIELSPEARLAYVSPSHQYPLGVTMSLARRLALLEWAKNKEAWILEDDYDSEYRYGGRPLAALQGLDSAARVIYMGTFSKVLFPALRLGYLIVPPNLVDAFVAARALLDRHSPLIQQAVLTSFIEEGHFSRHIRRMRMLYTERQALLVQEAERHLEGLLEVKPAEAGLHLIGWLPEGLDDRLASQQAARYGVEIPPLSSYALAPLRRGGLVIGYAGVPENEIKRGIQGLKGALSSLLSPV